MRELGARVYPYAIGCGSFDFWIGVVLGVVRALGKQKEYLVYNFINYYVIILPLSVYLALYASPPPFMDYKIGLPMYGLEHQGLGQIGIWCSFMCGGVYLLSTYCWLLYREDWDAVAHNSKSRMNKEVAPDDQFCK
mmetsp:Transcript_32275/g.49414  ORF Transcript_32275/g.49414 Transcript_32275/m.49414 type:complete len:136 (+) Transcript_32275:914-1321(+)